MFATTGMSDYGSFCSMRPSLPRCVRVDPFHRTFRRNSFRFCRNRPWNHLGLSLGRSQRIHGIYPTLCRWNGRRDTDSGSVTGHESRGSPARNPGPGDAEYAGAYGASGHDPDDHLSQRARRNGRPTGDLTPGDAAPGIADPGAARYGNRVRFTFPKSSARRMPGRCQTYSGDRFDHRCSGHAGRDSRRGENGQRHPPEKRISMEFFADPDQNGNIGAGRRSSNRSRRQNLLQNRRRPIIPAFASLQGSHQVRNGPSQGRCSRQCRGGGFGIDKDRDSRPYDRDKSPSNQLSFMESLLRPGRRGITRDHYPSPMTRESMVRRRNHVKPNNCVSKSILRFN